jgi:hypothetical protein
VAEKKKKTGDAPTTPRRIWEKGFLVGEENRMQTGIGHRNTSGGIKQNRRIASP